MDKFRLDRGVIQHWAKTYIKIMCFALINEGYFSCTRRHS